MTASLDRHSTPYKGTDSYQVEDADLFFGRDHDAEQLAARILSSRMTLLHAQSGAGKTSLLNAEVIPLLEKKGWIPVRVLPQNDPVASAWVSTLGYVLPPVGSEVIAIQRIRAKLAPKDDPTLGELLDRYDALRVRDPLKRSLIAPIDAEKVPGVPSRVQCPNFTPYVCRLFRSTCDMAVFADHFAAILSFGETNGEHPVAIGEDTRTSDFIALCASKKFSRAYARLLSTLDAPSSRLRLLLDNLVEVYGKRRQQFFIVILFDQFEELFTRFVDLGALARERQRDMPDWRLKYEFFEQLRDVYFVDPDDTHKAQNALPIRYVISMRSEYIAQLDPIRMFAPRLDAESFRLELLDQMGASEAIRSPASEYGFGYSDECYKEIARELTKEERFVEPAHIQIVCEKLWTTAGKKLSEEASLYGGNGEWTAKREIDVDVYRGLLGGAAGIMHAFLHDFVDNLDAATRLETLEMLEPLITSSGTRNILERTSLVLAPFRSRQRREEILAALVARTIVRVETRLGGQFVEITHEFLIPSIRQAIKEELYADAEYTRFRASVRMLGGLLQAHAGINEYPPITDNDFELLHKYRDRLDWNAWATELMFRQAVLLGADYDATRFWADELRKSRASNASAVPAADSVATPSEDPFVNPVLASTPHRGARDVAVAVTLKYLNATELHERRYALRALAALDSSEAAEILVLTGLDYSNEPMRDAAIDELVQLGDGINGEMAKALERRLREPDEARGVYELLGRLKRKGSPVSVTVPKGWTGLRLGLSLFRQLYPTRKKRKPWIRTMKAIFNGGFSIGVILAVLTIVAKPVTEIFSGSPININTAVARMFDGSYFLATALFLLIIALLSFVAVPVISRRASPSSFHYDAKVGTVSEILWALAGAFYFTGAATLLVLVPLIYFQGFDRASFVLQTPLAVTILTATLVAASVIPITVRYACTSSYRRGIATVERPIANDPLDFFGTLDLGIAKILRLSRAVLGSFIGMFSFALVFIPLTSLIGGSSDLIYMPALVITPLVTGLAAAYISIDEEDVIRA